MEKTTVYLPADLQRALQVLARRTGRSQADLIREAVAGYVRGQERPRLRSIGLGEDSRLSGAKSEEYLRLRWRADA